MAIMKRYNACDEENIYLIRNNDNQTYKIGYTFKNNYDDRLQEAQRGSSSLLDVVKFIHVKMVKKVAEMVKSLFKNKKLNGSWYKLGIQDLLDFENTCKEQENIALGLLTNPFFNKNYADSNDVMLW